MNVVVVCEDKEGCSKFLQGWEDYGRETVYTSDVNEALKLYWEESPNSAYGSVRYSMGRGTEGGPFDLGMCVQRAYKNDSQLRKISFEVVP